MEPRAKPLAPSEAQESRRNVPAPGQAAHRLRPPRVRRSERRAGRIQIPAGPDGAVVAPSAPGAPRDRESIKTFIPGHPGLVPPTVGCLGQGERSRRQCRPAKCHPPPRSRPASQEREVSGGDPGGVKTASTAHSETGHPADRRGLCAPGNRRKSANSAVTIEVAVAGRRPAGEGVGGMGEEGVPTRAARLTTGYTRRGSCGNCRGRCYGRCRMPSGNFGGSIGWVWRFLFRTPHRRMPVAVQADWIKAAPQDGIGLLCFQRASAGGMSLSHLG